MKYTIPFLILAASFCVGAAPAQANQSYIFGALENRRAVVLPNPVCAMPGHVLRVYSDAVDGYGRRYFLPLENFVWQLSRQNGYWERWSASYSSGFGPFNRSRRDSQLVYVTIPQDMGAVAQLAVGTRGAYDFILQVVDPRSGYSCQWAPAGVYHDPYAPPLEPIPTPVPTPVPSPMPPIVSPTPVPSTPGPIYP